jgi:hypothetical protein
MISAVVLGAGLSQRMGRGSGAPARRGPASAGAMARSRDV